MIASALAVGDVFCCRERGEENCNTVFGDERKAGWLSAYAFDEWGCSREWMAVSGIDPRGDMDDMTDFARLRCLYFDKFMEII